VKAEAGIPRAQDGTVFNMTPMPAEETRAALIKSRRFVITPPCLTLNSYKISGTNFTESVVPDHRDVVLHNYAMLVEFFS
jgi:hypothetical protein